MENLKSLYIDRASWEPPIQIDDFIVAIGKKQSNSVYHVASVRPSPSPHGIARVTRYNLKVYSSDLPTALQRDKEQQLITLYWYPR